MLIGLDIGGTNLKAVRMTSDGAIEEQVTVPAGGRIARGTLLEIVQQAVSKLRGGDRPGGVGIAVGGLIQPDGAMRGDSTNLPNLADLPLAETFTSLLGLPCRVEHDGRAAMRGEAWLGAARNARNAMTMTFGTGIGAGLLLDGRIHAGGHGGAGEIGVWRLDPQSRSTLEEVAAPVKIAAARGVDFAALFSAWQADPAIGLDVPFERIGRAIANAHLLLDLEVVVLFGAMVALGEPLRAAIERGFLDACPPDFRHGLSIRLSELGPLAGAVGAAALVRSEAAT